ncbi:MAG: hypothetical protein ACI3XC_10680 [Phascolarctobacterium sp.]
MAKRNLSAAYNNTAMEDVTVKSLGLAFPEDEEYKDKAPEPETVKAEAPVIKPEEKKVEKAPQKEAPKPEATPKKVITRNRVKKLTRPVSLIMDPVLFERLERASEETQRSINNYIALAVKNQLDRDGY